MISKGKLLRMAMCPVLLLVVAGCSGVSASHSVSPINFILPGLMRVDPQPERPAPGLPVAEPNAPVV